MPLKCAGTFKIAQRWEGPGLEPDGTKVVDVSGLSGKMGVRLSFVDQVLDAYDRDQEVAFDVQLCERVNDDEYWHCEGTYINLYDCHGKLAFSGFHKGAGEDVGHYVITGGTGQFEGAKGSIKETAGENGYYLREIEISY